MKKIYIERNKLFKNISMILFNNINTVDENFIDDNMGIYYSDCDDCEGIGQKDGVTCNECTGQGNFDTEPYQNFIVDVNEYDIERLKSYGVELGYSEKLELHILPIYDYGTSWSAFSYSKGVSDDYTLSFDETLVRNTVY